MTNIFSACLRKQLINTARGQYVRLLDDEVPPPRHMWIRLNAPGFGPLSQCHRTFILIPSFLPRTFERNDFCTCALLHPLLFPAHFLRTRFLRLVHACASRTTIWKTYPSTHPYGSLIKEGLSFGRAPFNPLSSPISKSCDS